MKDADPSDAVMLAITSEPGEWTLSTLAEDLGMNVDELFPLLLRLIQNRQIALYRARLIPTAEPGVPRVGTDLRQILDTVRERPGLTSREIHGHLPDMILHSITSSLGRLRSEGLVLGAGSPLRWFPVVLEKS